MLLYLNSKTWVDAEQCELLARDVRAAFESHRKTKIILLHENDRSRGGCEFVTFFTTTPQELIDGGIYRCQTDISNCNLRCG